MAILLKKKIVRSNALTDLVWQAFKSAVSEFTVTSDAMAPDEKSVRDNLETEEKKDMEGFFHRLIRYAGISHEAYYELDRLNGNIGEMPDVFFKALQSELLKELASSVYDSSSMESINKATKLMSIENIDNHYMLICEIILRIVVIALDENLISKRKSMDIVEDDKVVMVLKKFVRQLKENVEITGKLFGKVHESKMRVTSMVAFLDKLIDSKATEINSLIYSIQDADAPKKNFKLVRESLEQIQIKLRGYLLVYLDLISRGILNEPLVTSNDSLSVGMVLSFYPQVIKFLLAEVKPNAMGEEDDTCKEVKEILFMPDNIKIITMFIKRAHEIRDPVKKKSYIHSINEVKKLLVLDEQLNAIKEAVSQFIGFANLGGWIPIFLKVIRPEVLSKMITKFAESCKETTVVCFAYLNTHSEFSIGLATLPSFEWGKLSLINRAIWKLTSPEMINRVYAQFNTQIEGLVKVEELLFKHGLLTGNQHLIATTLTPQQNRRMISPHNAPQLPSAPALSHSHSSKDPISEQHHVFLPHRASSFNQMTYPSHHRSEALLYDASQTSVVGPIDRRNGPRSSPHSVTFAHTTQEVPHLPLAGSLFRDQSEGHDALSIELQPVYPAVLSDRSGSHSKSSGSGAKVGRDSSDGSGGSGRSLADSKRMEYLHHPQHSSTSLATSRLAPSSVLFPQNQPNLSRQPQIKQSESPENSPKGRKICCSII
jgi:hypothetical protein